MKKILILKITTIILIVIFSSGCTKLQALLPKNNVSQSNQNFGDKQTNFVAGVNVSNKDYLLAQSKIDKSLLKEFKKGYKINNPFVAVNPYGNSPLTALVMFNTIEKTKIKMTVFGHDKSVNIEHTFPSALKHILPIYGLYPGEKNKVEFVLDNGSKKIIRIETDPLNSFLSKAKVLKKVEGSFAEGLTFCDPATSSSENIFTMAYDSNGDIRWYLKQEGRSMPTRRLNNGRILSTTVKKVNGNYYSYGICEMDLIGKIYKEYAVPGGQHHDHYEMPNGNLIACGNELNLSTKEDVAYEIDRKTGKIVKTFDMKQYFSKTDGGSYNQKGVDWFHLNSISYNKATNTIMFSGRNIDAVVGIDYKTKKLKWILGTTEGWKNVDKGKFLKSTGKGFEWQFAQHAADFLPNGDIILFDNGSYRAKRTNPSDVVKAVNNYSRGVRYRIDTKTMTVSQIWQFGKERGPDWYSHFISDSDYLGDNHYLLTSGAIKATSKIAQKSKTPGVTKFGDIVEVKDDKVVFELLVNTNIYRSERLTLYTSKETYYFAH